MFNRLFGTVALAMSLLVAGPLHAEEIALRAVSGLPSNNPLNQRLKALVELVNERGTGEVRIDYVGGPEVIPPQQQDTALRNGVIDMIATPSSYYTGSVPEGNAVKGSNLTPAELRENGGYELLDRIWRQKINGVFVANVASGIEYHLYTTEMPNFDADGRMVLGGFTMRSTPAYNRWLQDMGASNIVLQASEIFPALERGIVDGLAWPGVGVTDLGVQDFVKYRIDPGVWQVDVAVVINQDKWNSLSEAAQGIIRQAAAEIEDGNKAFFADRQAEEDKILTEAGVEFLVLEGEQRDQFVEVANDSLWSEMAELSPENHQQLRDLLFRE